MKTNKYQADCISITYHELPARERRGGCEGVLLISQQRPHQRGELRDGDLEGGHDEPLAGVAARLCT